MKIINPVKNTRLVKYPIGNIYQGFGENPELYWKAIKSWGHNGIDIVAPFRTELPLTKGLVVETFNQPTGYGKYIRLLTEADKNGNLFELVYGHNDENIVKTGDFVDNGKVGGYMGNTGFVISGSTPYWGNAPAGKGVHLHFGVRPASLYKTTEKEGEKFYSIFGKTIYFPYYENGTLGYVDPLKHIEVDANLAIYFWGLLESMKMKLLELKNKGR